MTTSEPVVALVVAAGSGVRLGGEGPKALRPLAGRPLIRHAIEALVAGGVRRLVVTIREQDRALFTEALADVEISADVDVPVELVAGGAERQDSVRLGLSALADSGARIVLVHDAARPLVPVGVVRAVIDAVAAGATAVVPGTAVVDSIRTVHDAGSTVVDRSTLVGVQTPQGFDLPTLIRGHDHVRQNGLAVTDDAAVCELLGEPVTIVPGSREALKITEPVDLVIAEALLAAREASS